MKIIGVIGLGSIGARHERNIKALGHDTIGYDPIAFPSRDLRETLAASDAVVIASPTEHHIPTLDMAARMGKPALVEKPVGSSENSFPLVRNAERMVPLMVGYNLRFHSCVKIAKERLDYGLLGEPLWASFTCAQFSDKPAYLRDGVILNWSHEIDLALYLLGLAKVSGSSTHLTDGRDDMTDILLTHDGGWHTSIHLDYLTRTADRRFKIVGTKGWMFADLIARKICLRARGIDLDHSSDDSFDENYIEEMKAFLDRIDGKSTLGATGEDGLRALEICLEVRRQAGLEIAQ
jgi:myo-inositol 2-dehydrogenase/D-chiro-inositol 1-dehydrogenase